MNFLLFCYIEIRTWAITILSGALYSANVKLVKTTILEMKLTIEITTSKNVTRKCTTTIYNTAKGELTSGLSSVVKLLAQIINNNFVSNFLLFALLLYSKSDKGIKILSHQKILDMGITIQITTSNNVTGKCTTNIYNTATGALTSGISVFVQKSSRKSLITFLFLSFYFFVVFEIQHKQ